MHNPETKKTSPNLLTRTDSFIFKAKTSKKNSRSVAYKPLQKTVSLPKFSLDPVTSRKEMTMSFLREMLCDVIAHREYASSKDLTDSAGTTVSFDHFFGTTSNLKEFEEDSKKSIISSHKESKTSELEPERIFYKGISCEYCFYGNIQSCYECFIEKCVFVVLILVRVTSTKLFYPKIFKLITSFCYSGSDARNFSLVSYWTEICEFRYKVCPGMVLTRVDGSYY